MSERIDLPPTIPGTDVRIHWRLIWPGHGHFDVWLVDGDFAIDAAQVVERLDITNRATFERFPPTWWHLWTPPPTRALKDSYLWSRRTALQATSELAPDFDLEAQFSSWFMGHFHEAERHWADLVEESTPKRVGEHGVEYPIRAAARKLAARYGGRVSDVFVFAQLCRLSWLERDTEQPEHGRYRPTPRGLTLGYVFSRGVKLPGARGRYEQCFLTEAGLDALSGELRTFFEQPLVDLEAVTR